MKFVVVALMMVAAHAGVVSRDWRDGKLSLTLEDGTAEMEWISPTAFRFVRSWGGAPEALRKISHEKISPSLEEAGPVFTMRTKYLTAELDRGDLKLRVRSGQTPVANSAIARTDNGVELRLGLTQDEKVFGLMGGSTGRLNVRGEALDRARGFFFTSGGYGIYLRSPERCRFDLASGTVNAPGAKSIEYTFYYGPTPKEILEQHLTVAGETEVTSLNVHPVNRLPKEATPLPAGPIDSWESLRALVRTLSQWSLSAVLYPALDLASFDRAPADVKQRAADLSAMLPVVYRTSGDIRVDREAWKPYLTTYLREAHDRGIPLLRPLPLQFARDAKLEEQADVFMLGDEILLAPVLGPSVRRRVELPKGLWTDWRTNVEYKGNQAVEVDAPVGRVPMFVRNGWIVPLAAQGEMELHYFPSLGAEFFLWEPEANDNSQFHAAPAGEYVRVEIESQVGRMYEWVLHHTKAARAVGEESTVYQRVGDRALLRPGTWWHDAAKNNLHVMLWAEAGSDRIVNLSF